MKTNRSARRQGTQAGGLFQYVIKTPVSLARQKSAMLPIVSQNVEGEKLSIYNEQVQAKYPLNGFRLKNTTSLHLMQGPITVFDANTYAGDARMEDMAAGQERLISYALDIKTEVEPQSKTEPQLSQSSDFYQRYVKELDQQETELENLRKEIEGLKDAEAKQQRDLNDYLLNLEVE